MVVSTQIRKWREIRKFSPTELAYKSGMSTSYLYTLEKQRKTDPQFGIIDGISRELGVPISELFGVEISAPDGSLVFIKVNAPLSPKSIIAIQGEAEKVQTLSSVSFQKCILFLKDMSVKEEGIQFFREGYVLERRLEDSDNSFYKTLTAYQREFYLMQYADRTVLKEATVQMSEDVEKMEKLLKQLKISFERFYRPVEM